MRALNLVMVIIIDALAGAAGDLVVILINHALSVLIRRAFGYVMIIVVCAFAESAGHGMVVGIFNAICFRCLAQCKQSKNAK